MYKDDTWEQQLRVGNYILSRLHQFIVQAIRELNTLLLTIHEIKVLEINAT